MKSATATKIPNGHGSLYKEVRFSPTNTPIKRAHSVANEHPTLSSDHLRSFEMAKQSLPGLALGYIEQSRSVLDRQRANFDRERTTFAEERQLWEKERELLKLRISELESLLKSRGIPTTSATGALPLSGPSSISPSQVWEGSSPMSRPTRVFPDEERTENTEQGANSNSHSTLPAPSLDAALSPKSHPVESSGSISVPIEKLDSTLDGITLKSSALHPDVVARVMTPPSPSSREHSPECPSSDKPNMDRRNSVKLKLSDLGPPETNLLRDAGHTPMVVIDRDVDTAQGSPGEPAPEEQEEALTPPATWVRQPTERADSYFSGVTDLPDDPALKGPLSLLNEKGHDEDFLQEVDMKLLGQARQILGPPKGVKEDEEEEEAETENPPKQGEKLTEIKFRNTTNFGTAFGQSI